MLTTSQAARLLQAAGAHPLDTLLSALGFTAPLDLPRRERARLGLDGDAPARAAVAAGEGTLRALLLEWDDGAPLRERLAALAPRIARAAPAVHWLLCARQRARGEVGLAAPAADPRGPLPALVIECARVRESDAETFAVLSSVDDTVPALRHLRWREVLGRDALTRRFYRDLERAVDRLATTAHGRATDAERRTIALLAASRLLFLSFIEAKGWLDADRAFLRHQVERLAGRGPLQSRLLDPLCFGTLNTPVDARSAAALAFGRVPFLNGGLFTRSPLERRRRALRLDDDAIAALACELLPRYRLTAREASTGIADAAVDPEMLGRAFESLMQPAVRRARGSFYTPPALIDGLASQAFGAAARADDARGADPRVLDPACGSGAFLVHALEALASARIARGDARPVSAVRRDVLARSIFGVDLDPMAVWLCQLRLWLSVVVEDEREDPMRLPPLPNLDRNIREGDALAGLGFEQSPVPGAPELARLRMRYARASGIRKRTLARALDALERRRAVALLGARVTTLTHARRELLAAARAPDLFASRRGLDPAARAEAARIREALRDARRALRALRDGGALPFDFATHFPDVAAAGGFDVVIGNPPWVRPHALAAEARESLRTRFVTARQAAWEEGAALSGAGRGFASQADLAALFVERSVALARPFGVIALLLPSKLWSALAGGGVRRHLLARTRLVALEDWGGASAGFDAVVYPSALVARRRADASAAGGGERVRLTVHERDASPSFDVALRSLALDASPGAPWLLVPPDVRAAFDLLVARGVPLAESAFGRPVLGVKSGCNEAFVVERDAEASASVDGTVRVRSGTVHGEVEQALLRPLLRGEHLRRFGAVDSARSSAIVWTHAGRGEARDALPRAAERWLLRWRRQLEQRTDARHARWWTLFRTEAARADRPRVVWGDIGRAPRALVLRAGDPAVPLNSCYVVRAPSEDDAHALAALLNSRVASAWLRLLAEPARGGYHRFMGWTCARLPLPRDWGRARALLAPLGRAGALGDGGPSAETELTQRACTAYGLAASDLNALLRDTDER